MQTCLGSSRGALELTLSLVDLSSTRGRGRSGRQMIGTALGLKRSVLWLSIFWLSIFWLSILQPRGGSGNVPSMHTQIREDPRRIGIFTTNGD